jgi:hypothetical protein
VLRESELQTEVFICIHKLKLYLLKWPHKLWEQNKFKAHGMSIINNLNLALSLGEKSLVSLLELGLPFTLCVIFFSKHFF